MCYEANDFNNEHYSLTLMSTYKQINANMMQDWIREVNRNFGRANPGKRLGESLYMMYHSL